MIERHSTRDAAPAHRRDYWNQLVGESYSGLVVDPLEPQFHAHMLRWGMNDLNLVRPRSAGAVIARRRPPRHVSEQRLIFHLVQAGSLRLQHRGKEVQLSTGDLVVCADEEPYRFDVKDRHELLIVDVGRARLTDRLPSLDDRIGEPIARSATAVRVLHDFLLSLWRAGTRSIDDLDSLDYSDVLVSLMAGSLEGAGALNLRTSDPLFERMKCLVAARFGDSDLSPSMVAHELNIGLRTLQLCVARHGTTPAAYIADHRLGWASRQLGSNPHASIAGVAYACGFVDPAYFTRRFAQKFGMSPKAYRAAH